MAEFFVWVTTRGIKEGTLDDLRRAWEPPEPQEGMTRAFEWVSDDGRTLTITFRQEDRGVLHSNQAVYRKK